MYRTVLSFGLLLAFSISCVRAEDAPAPVCACKPLTISVRGAAPRATDAITVKNFTYMSANLTINIGDTVTWTNTDSAPHTATSDSPLFDTGTLTTGQSASFTFTTAGTFPYHCTIHPFMTASITVNGSAAPPVLTHLTASATAGAKFSYTITATGTQPITFSATLPSGLTLSNATISGTFTTAGTVSIPLTATNSAGSDSQLLVVTVAPAGAAANLTGTWAGTLKSKSFSQIGTSPKPASKTILMAIVQTGTALTATITVQGGSGSDTAGLTGNGNLWLSGGDGLETFALSGHLDKKGTTISGTGILYDASGDQEVTFKATKQ